MNTSNITTFKIDTIEPVTLDSVLKLMETWRANKKSRRDKIPRELWDKIFILVKTIPISRVLSAMGITRQQFQNEQQERNPLVTPNIVTPTAEPSHEQPVPPTEFCEATSAFPLEYKPAKAFSTTTAVVELYRPDGMLMKIHICTDKFEDLLHAFFKGSFK
jgi:hypothetical protein